MKASELIAALQAEIAKHGDLPVMTFRPGSHKRVAVVNTLQVWFKDSENTEPAMFMPIHNFELNDYQKQALKSIEKEWGL